MNKVKAKKKKSYNYQNLNVGHVIPQPLQFLPKNAPHSTTQHHLSDLNPPPSPKSLQLKQIQTETAEIQSHIVVAAHDLQ
jgi:hypothetical protein